MKQLLFSIYFSLFIFFASFIVPNIYAAGNCCVPGAVVNSDCTTVSGNYGTCQGSQNKEPYFTQCTKATPTLRSCFVQCSGVYCAAGATAGSSCTTPDGTSGKCAGSASSNTECPNTSGNLTCVAEATPAGCCPLSATGSQCYQGNGNMGTCRTPSGAMEMVACTGFNYCGAQTTSGSFMCSCTKTTYGYNCSVAGFGNTCQGGLQPNTNLCSTTSSVNPCGGSASSSNCQMPCVPGGNMAWGDVGCVPPNPNQINNPAKICVPGIVCEGGICMKQPGSVYFGDACKWTAECGTCKTAANTTIQMTCRFSPSNPDVGMCDGTCGGGSAIQGNDAAFCDRDYTQLNSAIGCIPIDDVKRFSKAMLGWGTAISAGLAFILLLIAGFQFATSGGDKKRVQAAKELTISALTGLVLVALCVVLLNFLGVDVLNLSSLGFQS